MMRFLYVNIQRRIQQWNNENSYGGNEPGLSKATLEYRKIWNINNLVGQPNEWWVRRYIWENDCTVVLRGS